MLSAMADQNLFAMQILDFKPLLYRALYDQAAKINIDEKQGQ